MIQIRGEPMIRVAVENRLPSAPYRYIFVCRRAHFDAFGLAESLGDDMPEGLLKRADQALNPSKNGGRNCVSAAAA